jgi:guanosine-3',5'-bis(diphosphate) 3'-pyrophosphohydrolase
MQNKHELKNLIEQAGTYLPPSALDMINQAHAIVAKSYPEDLEHVISTASTVAGLQLDERCIAAALLHKIPQHKNANIAEIEAKFGADVFKLIDRLSKVEKVSWMEEHSAGKSETDKSAYAESLRKMLIAMTEDFRVVFIKLACRLHEISWVHNVSRLDIDKRTKKNGMAEALPIAQETLHVYAPMAHRLGMWELKSQLEDMAFSCDSPIEYDRIDGKINANKEEKKLWIGLAMKMLGEELEKAEIKAEITGRIKPVYSYKRKEQKYEKLDKTRHPIFDLMGIRIIVNDVKDCYNALGVIHKNAEHPEWHPIPSEFDDYIANPRGGTYQSIHTTVTLSPNIPPFEIQIRTREMHKVAEYGVAAHWRYKSDSKLDEKFDKRITGLRALIEQFKDITGSDFVELMEIDLFGDTVMVYTPKGQVKDMPAGSTPLDFAYRVHTDLGHRCTGAKVNGRMVPLTHQLKSGDTVEIIAPKGDKGPSRDWLNADLGYLHTSHAKEKVRQWFRKQERGENIERGKEILDKELRRLGISITEDELAVLFKKESREEFLAAIGYGDISTHQIANRLAVPEEKPIPQVAPKKQGAASGIQVMGVDNLLTQIATCCNPMPGDDIIGYVTRSRGISVHRKDCSNIINTTEKERLINVGWGTGEQLYSVPVRVDAFDRVGLLRDITGIVAEEGVNIASATMAERVDGTSVITLTLQTRGLGQLSRLLSKIEGIQGVINVARLT